MPHAIENSDFARANRTPIAFCITDLDPGGAEKALYQILKHLDLEIWSPTVYCLGPEAELCDAIRPLGIEVECYGAKSSQNLGVVLWLFRRLKRRPPQILQCLLFHANIVGRVAGRLAGVPVIVAGHRVAEHEKRWHLRAERWTQRLVDHHICVSQGVADHLSRETGVPLSKITVIANGVEIPAGVEPVDLRRAFGIPEAHKVVLAAGRLHRQKGFDLLLETFPNVLSQAPQTTLLIVGDGPERPALEDQRSRLRLKEQVVLPGRDSNLPGVMAACDVFVLPSRWEGMPNVVLEAMAIGLPVLAAPVEGISELLLEHNNGSVADPRNREEWASRLILLLRNDQLRIEFSRESQVLCRKLFTWDSVAQDYEELYRKLANL
ncbi:MAG: glycosyltransferase [Planctomycetaceae bacterium]|nr:glycosyltransferase [Planctomycetaceae bacterium]